MATVIISPPANSMSASPIKRRWGQVSAAVNTVLANCDVIDVRDFRDIAVKPPVSVTSLTVYSSETENGTYVIVNDIGTAGVVTVVADKWNVLDTTKIGPFGFIKLLSAGASGSAVVQGKT